MPRGIIRCEDCGAARHNPRFKNTLYCNADRLLRDLLYVGDEQRPCRLCSKPFAPVSRKDTLCGTCHYGSSYTGDCLLCKRSDVELHRPGVFVCIQCTRDPAKRHTLISGLKKGQRDRRLANNHVSKADA